MRRPLLCGNGGLKQTKCRTDAGKPCVSSEGYNRKPCVAKLIFHVTAALMVYDHETQLPHLYDNDDIVRGRDPE